MKTLKKPSLITFAELFLLAITAFYNFQHFAMPKLGGNAASRVLLAVGPIFKIGRPYADLYEFVPPGFLILISGWIKIFGLDTLYLRLFHVIFITLSGLFILIICRRIFKKRIVEFVVFSAATISLHSGIIQTDIFSVDFLGTTFALGGLAALLYFKSTLVKLLLGITLIMMASQIKDYYVLPILALAPIYFREVINRNKRDFCKLVFITLAGPLLIIFSVLFYLYSNSAIEGYIQILHDKAAFAQYGSFNQLLGSFNTMIDIFNENFLQFPNIIKGLIVANLFLAVWLYSRKPKKRLRFKFDNAVKWLNNYSDTYTGKILTTLVYIVFLLLGLTFYGQYSVDTRFSAIVFSLFILSGLLIAYTIEIISQGIKNKLIKILIVSALLILLVPKSTVLKSYNFLPAYRGSYNFEVEKEIMKRTKRNDCILHVYGWGVSATYIYTKRPPCSKYFLPNSLHQVRRQSASSEYRKQIFANPPSVIIYTTQLTDFNMMRFEGETINLPNVLVNCYEPDPKYKNYLGFFRPPITVYWPKISDKEELKKCFVTHGQPKARDDQFPPL